MRVLMCGSDLGSVKGGMVTVVSNYLASSFWEESEIRYIATHREGGKIMKSLWFALAYARILKILLLKKADVVHLHVAERGSFYRKAILVTTCHRFHIPVLLHHHGAEFEDFYGKLPTKRKEYVKKILEQADRNLVLSEALLQKLLQKAPKARAEVLHNAVDVKEENEYLLNKKDRLVMFGVQGKRKGSYDLLEALAQIDSRLPDELQVWMCGDGETEKVKERAGQLGLQKRVAHVGWISGEEKERCLSRTMIHVLPSYREALPMSILETMGRGIPNISTNIASIPEVVRNGVNGYLLEPGDVKSLGEAILDLVENKERRKEFSIRSHERIRQEFSLQSCIRKLEQIYRELQKEKEQERM